MRRLLTTQEAAVLAGVGPTAIKRWADAGVLRCVRTAGGHRRFLEADLGEYLDQHAPKGPKREDEVEAWLDALLGAATVQDVQALLLELHTRYGAWYRAATFVGAVLNELGARWARGDVSIIEEHLTSDRLLRGLGRIGESIPVGPQSPVMLLTAVEGDEHLLGLALVELCARECGLRTRWPGRATPVEEVVSFVQKGGAEIVAASASPTAGGQRRLRTWLKALEPVCRAAGVELLLGGEGRWPAATDFAIRMRSFDELHAFLTRRQAEPRARRRRGER